MPPVFENGVLDYVDLDLDVLVWTDFSYEILDSDDFEKNAEKYGYSANLQQTVNKNLEEIIGLIETKAFPFDQI